MHVIEKLYQAEYDFPQCQRQSMSYMIATIPRSGSTYFAIELWRSGLLGSPMEYLNFAAAAPLMRRLGLDGTNAHSLDRDTIKRYWATIKRLRTSPNGVFGYKMFMIVFRDLIQTHPDIFEDIQPDYVVYLTRQDILGQAISYSRAKLTKMWFADASNATNPSYDYNHIVQCRREIEKQCFYWESVFMQAKIEPIRVTYEELLESPDRCVDRSLAEMGIKRDPVSRLSIPIIRQQADAITKEWRTRFEEDSRAEE